MVHSQIIKANGEPVKVDYVMRRNGEGWLISDIYLDGAISEVATRRSEFAAILKNDGIDGLIAALNPHGGRFHPNASAGRPVPPPGAALLGRALFNCLKIYGPRGRGSSSLPPARMMPGFEANDQDARPQSWVSSARANSGVSRAVLPPAGKRSREGVPSAAFARLTFPTDSPGRRDRDHRSAPDLPADTCPRTETAQEAPEQGLFRQGTHHQEPLDVFKPQARIARPLVEFGPRRALVQYVGFRHDRPPRQRHLGVGQVPDK
jgi:hypothetical protein